MCSNFHGYRPLDDMVEESRYTPKNIHVSRTRNTNLYLNKKDGLVVNFVKNWWINSIEGWLVESNQGRIFEQY